MYQMMSNVNNLTHHTNNQPCPSARKSCPHILHAHPARTSWDLCFMHAGLNTGLVHTSLLSSLCSQNPPPCSRPWFSCSGPLSGTQPTGELLRRHARRTSASTACLHCVLARCLCINERVGDLKVCTCCARGYHTSYPRESRLQDQAPQVDCAGLHAGDAHIWRA